MTESTIRKLGKYEIIEEMGRGGFATVYRARDPDLDREVALKVLDPLLTRDPVWVARFQAEARAVARLKHPHIVTVYEIGQAEGLLYIAMELIDGPSLGDLIAQQGRLSWDDTLGILSQLADALDYAHDEGVLHRDLKPGNILLDERRGAVVTDFGFAKLVGESSMSVSISGGVVGTPQYIAPEVWEGQAATAQTDIYALGCIVYEMLTGEVLFSGSTPPAVMRKHLLDGPQLPVQWPEGVPQGMTDVLAKALDSEPDQRFETPTGFEQALRAERLEGEHEPGKPVELQPAGKVEHQIPIWIWGVGMLVVVGLAVFAVILLRDEPESPDISRGAPSPSTAPSMTAISVPEVPTPSPTATYISASEPTVTVTATRLQPATSVSTPEPMASAKPAATATRTPTKSTTVTVSATKTPSPVPSITPMPTATSRPTGKAVVPTSTPDPLSACDPSKANAEVFAEIVYPQPETVVKPNLDGVVDIFGTAAGSAFTRYTFYMCYYWCPRKTLRFINGCFQPVCWSGEAFEKVVCGQLYQFDTSAWKAGTGGGYYVFLSLNAVKPDSNYDRDFIKFWMER